MENIIAESDLCKIVEIIDCLKDKEKLVMDYQLIAKELNITLKIKTVNIDYESSEAVVKYHKAALLDILTELNNSHSKKAALKLLVNALRRCGMTSLADSIEDRFGGFILPGSSICITSEVVAKSSNTGTALLRGHFCSNRQVVKQIALPMRSFCDKMISKWGNSTLRSFNVVELFNWVTFADHLYLALELGNESLAEKIDKHKRTIKLDCIIDFIHDATKGLAWLHENDIVHGNIKPENVIIFTHGKREMAKLTDIGLSRIVDDAAFQVSVSSQCESPEERNCRGNGVNFVPTKEMDIYSLGVVGFYAIGRNATLPFIENAGPGKQNVRQLSGGYIQVAANNLFNWMFHVDPSCRPTIKQIETHPFFWSKEKCLTFLGDIIRASSEANNKTWETIRDKINNAYSKYRSQQYNNKFSWEPFVDQRLCCTPNDPADTSTNNKHTYYPNYIMSLIKLIRDKEQHYQEMDVGIVTDHFTDPKCDMGFSRQMFISYFLNLFRDIIIIPFCGLIVLDVGKEPFLDAIRNDYLKEYQDLRHNECWTDKTVAIFLSKLA